jgi:hypothetical protein
MCGGLPRTPGSSWLGHIACCLFLGHTHTHTHTLHHTLHYITHTHTHTHTTHTNKHTHTHACARARTHTHTHSLHFFLFPLCFHPSLTHKPCKQKKKERNNTQGIERTNAHTRGCGHPGGIRAHHDFATLLAVAFPSRPLPVKAVRPPRPRRLKKKTLCFRACPWKMESTRGIERTDIQHAWGAAHASGLTMTLSHLLWLLLSSQSLFVKSSIRLTHVLGKWRSHRGSSGRIYNMRGGLPMHPGPP